MLLLVVFECVATPKPHDIINRLNWYSSKSLNATMVDLQKTAPEKFNTNQLQKIIADYDLRKSNLIKSIRLGDVKAIAEAELLLKSIDGILLGNPLIENKKIVAVRRQLGDKARQAMNRELGVGPSNFQNNSEIPNPLKGWTNEFVVISATNGGLKEKTLYKPHSGRIIADPEPHFDGVRLLFSSIGTNDRWHLFELNTVTKSVKQVTPDTFRDFDSFDGCYTPDDRIIFCSTATFLGLPCTYGGNKMSGLFQYNPKTKVSRQLTFDQDSNWGPVVLNNGQILYQRWEYADLAHSNSRIIFTMNPDGTSQQAYYGSNSYFPTAFFGSRPVPNHPTAFVGVATGHHSVARCGRLMIIDPMKGRHEADGVVCEIPYPDRKVEPLVRDRFPDGIYPMFLQPFPLSDKYIVVAVKPSPTSLWGLYLADTNGNMTLIKEEEGVAYLEPVLMEKRKTPSVIPDRIIPDSKTATVFIQDIYTGGGLKDIPKGAVKKLRVGSYTFGTLSQGGLVGTIGMDGPWDVKQILGTVDVEPDGSAMFTIPANKPIFLQPLDEEGKAVQLMRSWFTAMPGESVSCIGCHESRNSIPIPKPSLASVKKPQQIKEWHGNARGFSYRHEVQPVLDANCVSCHNESNPKILYLKGDKYISDWSSKISGSASKEIGGHFTVSYANLHRYVRRPGIEGDLHMLTPMEFHADQTELMQMLNKGHKGVKLTPAEIEKLACWIDFNAPFHGTRKDIPAFERSRYAIDLRNKNAGLFGLSPEEPESLPEPVSVINPVVPSAPKVQKGDTIASGWPFDRKYADDIQLATGQIKKTIRLSENVTLNLIHIPAGSFIMGSILQPDEMPMTKTTIRKSFWMGQFEITNEQFRVFDPAHDSRSEDMHGYQFGQKCYPVNDPDLPVVRVSWQQAMDFCKWLSKQTGLKCSLPTEAQWEWACRAGSNKPFWFGHLGSDFSRYANMGDIRLRDFAVNTAEKNYETIRLIHNPNKYDDWVPRDTLINDGSFLSEKGGRFIPNFWDLYDMHGNVLEWTLSMYKSYPYSEEDGRNATEPANVKRVARGGSWYDRPFRSTASFRIPYREYQKVFNVGFRVVIEDNDE